MTLHVVAARGEEKAARSKPSSQLAIVSDFCMLRRRDKRIQDPYGAMVLV